MSNIQLYPIIVLLIICVTFHEVFGHGMLLDPVSRSSRWRVDRTAPANYDDNALFCGGFGTQWGTNGGKCGLCGDDYSAPTPRPNELGGKYGQGVITKIYKNVKVATLGIKITANHLGFFYFHLCNLDEFGKETEECFNKRRLLLADRSDRLYIGSQLGWVNATVVLPEGLNCKHCVLRWTYQGGNNWGYCTDGSGALGCGAQENFRGCSDISIINTVSRDFPVKEPETTLKPEDDVVVEVVAPVEPPEE